MWTLWCPSTNCANKFTAHPHFTFAFFFRFSVPFRMATWLAGSGRRSADYFIRSIRTSASFFRDSDHCSVTSRKPYSRFPCRHSSPASFFRSRRFESSEAGPRLDLFSSDDDDEEQIQSMDFPGGKIDFTSEMSFIPESFEKRVQCYRVLDDYGYQLSSTISLQHVHKELAMKMYSGMVTLETLDTLMYEAQRQGRISFYMTSFGEEAINLASAAAFSSNDLIMPQYREPGILWWRGFTLQEFVNQCFGNKNDNGKGRQMPVHYGSKKHNFLTVSSPLATQLPQAVGAAYSLKTDKKDACVVAFFGDGSSSEGDFHASLNFAAVLEAPVVFICRNNGWAISTPTTEQFRSDGIVVKGHAYGIRSIRVDGNDALAVYNAVRVARNMVVTEQRPILIEAMTYRVGHHSTSDDSTKYRVVDEIEHWKASRNPVSIFRKWVQRKGWWSDEQESEFRANIRKQVINAIQVAEKTEKPSIENMFSDVYEEVPSNLKEQERLIRDTINRHPQDYPTDVPL